MKKTDANERRRLIGDILREDRGTDFKEVRRRVRKAGHKVSDSTIRKDISKSNGELDAEAIERRRYLVSVFMTRKMTRAEMLRGLANAGFAISQTTLTRDIAEVRDIWKQRIAQNVTEVQAEQLADLVQMERDIEQEIASSKDPQVRARNRQLRIWVKKRIAAMMGLDAPEKHEHEVELVAKSYSGFDPEDL